jgi:microcystin-dependent protein
LNCDGTVYTASAIYGVGNPTPLLNLLGSTFGGNGITTFGVPDLRARSRISLDGGSGRVTTAGSGIDGTTINSGGGAQNYIIAKTNIPNYNITITYGINVTLSGSVSTSGFGVFVNGVQANTGGNSTTTTTVASGGSGTPLVTMPPTLVSGLTFIKT